MKKGYCIVIVALFSLLAVASALAQPIEKQILYKKTTTLLYPNNYTLKFSLWDAEMGGNMVWSEEKEVPLTSSSTIKTYLGDHNPLNIGDFSQQLWVQVEKKRADLTYKVVGTRDMLRAAPYSLGAPVIPAVFMIEQPAGSLTVPQQGQWSNSTPICYIGPYTPATDKRALIDAGFQYNAATANTAILFAAYSTDGGTSWSTINNYATYLSNTAGAWSGFGSLSHVIDLTVGTTYAFAIIYESGSSGFTATDSLCRLRVTIVDQPPLGPE